MDTQPDTTTQALTLTLELARSQDAGDAHAFRFVCQDYVLRREEGFGSATFPWSDELLADLAELERTKPDSSRVQKLGDTLRIFLENSLSTLEGWGHHEQAILQAVEDGRPVRVTLRFGAAELGSEQPMGTRADRGAVQRVARCVAPVIRSSSGCIHTEQLN